MPAEPRCPSSEALAAYQAGALSPSDQVGLEAHLAVCDLCQETLLAVVDAADLLPSAVPARGKWGVYTPEPG